MRANLSRLLTVVVLSALAAACGGGTGGEGGSPTPSTEPDGSKTSGCTFDGDLDALLECVKSGTPVEQATANAAPPNSNTEGTSGSEFPYTVEEYLEYIIGDLDRVWSKWFLDNQFAEPLVGYRILLPRADPFVSKCVDQRTRQPLTVSDSYPNAFYCSADELVGADGQKYEGNMLLPVTTFQKMWTGDILGRQSEKTGDFGAAIIAAHEFGHHIQDELMLQYNEAVDPDVAAPAGKNNELIADCFAGVWVTSAYYSGLLTDTDFQEGVAALEAIGDDLGSHGTPQERQEAMQLGYHGISGTTAPGDPLTCVQTYWR